MADSKVSALTALTGASVDPVADLLYIDDVSVTTSKKIIVDELGIALKFGAKLLSSATASTSATIDFTSTYITSAYDEYEIHIVDLVPDTNGTSLLLRVSQSGVFDSGSTSYAYTVASNNDAGATITGSGSTSASSILIAGNCSTEATKSVNGVIRLYKPSGTSHRKAFRFDMAYQADTVVASMWTGVGAFQNGVGAIDGVRVLSSSGNIASGAIYLFGVRKT